jgi:hypothetical protein
MSDGPAIWAGYPVISTRKDGDRLIGERGPFAVELYAAGTPPMHGFAARRPVAARVSRLRIGNELQVERRGDEWVALDGEGVVGHLRWLAVDDGRPDVNGMVIRYPARGALRVRRLVIDPEGTVKDVGGEVTPTERTLGVTR